MNASYSYDGLMRQDDFGGSSLPSGWTASATGVSVSGGYLNLTGAGNWNVHAYRDVESIHDRQGIQVIFKVSTTSARGSLFVDAGDWGQANYRKWGLYLENGTIYRESYVGTTYERAALLSTKANTWYIAQFSIDPNDQYRITLWEKDNPLIWAQNAVAHSDWANLNWQFVTQAHTGVWNIDQYKEQLAYSAGQRTTSSTWLYSTIGSASNVVHDSRGRVVKETQTLDSNTFVTQMSYNSADMVTALTYPGNNSGGAGEKLTYAYYNQWALDTRNTVSCVLESIWSDHSRRLTGTPGTSTDDYYYLQQGVYDEAGRMRSLRLGGTYQANQATVQTQYDYFNWTTQDGLGRLKQITAGTTTDPDSLLDLRYFVTANGAPSYDASGNLDTIYRYTNGTTLLETQTFTQDTMDRLLSAAATGSASYSETYGYDTNTGNLNSKSSLGSYTYAATRQGTCSTGTNSAIKHAVSAAGSNTYQYDCNGNMTQRVVGGQTYNLSYDQENCILRCLLTGVSGAATASFTYNADGARVKSVVGGTTTYFVGEMVEWTGSTSTMKQYFSLGGRKIAMRTGTGGTLNWLIGDHLGSTVATANATGGSTGAQWYRAWGEVRPGPGNGLATRYTFTGQADDGIGGLMFYRARWLDNQLGRFVQADSIIPGAGNPLAWDRYAGMANNAVRYADPSGHSPSVPCTDDWCGEYNLPFTGGGTMKPAGSRSTSADEDYGITLDGFSDENVHTIRAEFRRIANKLWAAFYSFVCGSAPCPDIEFSPVEIFKAVFGPMTWSYQLDFPGGCNASSLECGGEEVSNYSTRDEARGLMTHEFGHLFEHRITGEWGYGRGILHDATILTANNVYVSGYLGGVGYVRTTSGYRSGKRPDIQHRLDDPRGCGGGTACEDFADMFMNWAQNSFSTDAYGQARYNWMDQRMGAWVVSSVYRNP